MDFIDLVSLYLYKHNLFLDILCKRESPVLKFISRTLASSRAI